ncbi:MAG: class I SAM-dependent methyltransferase, partial [Firmicutes bacterium]|nr:class I SAM-dependent methyltransferase [Bacillota bacterium]
MENDHKDKLEKLADIILEWNEKINVTAIRDRAEFMKKNVEDSLEVLKLPEFSDAKRILDLGTGGGFPGLPLAIACPDKEFYLLDSVAKKLKVVAIAADELGLENV